jgi:hypothetical protein
MRHSLDFCLENSADRDKSSEYGVKSTRVQNSATAAEQSWQCGVALNPLKNIFPSGYVLWARGPHAVSKALSKRRR